MSQEGDFLTCYYIGAIQYAFKKGRRWRLDMDRLFRRLGFVQGRNPYTVEETLFQRQFPGKSLEEITAIRNNWKLSGKWKQYHEHMWLIRLADIGRGVLGSDFVVLYWQVGVEKGGTLDELFCATKCGIPIFVVINQPIHTMNDWVLDVLREMEKENYPQHLKETMGLGLTKFAHIFPSFRAVARYVAEHREELLAKKRFLKEAGILEFRRQLAPLFLIPGALFDYVWSTKEQYGKWLEQNADYQIKEPQELRDIFENS